MGLGWQAKVRRRMPLMAIRIERLDDVGRGLEQPRRRESSTLMETFGRREVNEGPEQNTAELA
jgi:hypothetical protein